MGKVVLVAAMLTLRVCLSAAAQSSELQSAARRVAAQAQAMRVSAQEYLDESRTEVDVTERKDDLIRRLAREHASAADTPRGFFKRQTNQGKREMSELERDIADDNIDRLEIAVRRVLTARKEHIIEATVKLLQKIGESDRPARYTTQPAIVDGELIQKQVLVKSREERELQKYSAVYSTVTAHLETITANIPLHGTRGDARP